MIVFTGLKTALNQFDKTGKYTKCGNWSIANGGYDLWWEIYYNGYTVLQCVAGKLCGNFRPSPEFTESIENKLIKYVKRVFTDL